MTAAVAEDALARGHEALAAGDWDGARAAFREALDLTDSPEALDGLGRALWWLRDERGAVVHRERAYAGHLPYLHAGSEVVEFSPSAELHQTMEVVERNMAAVTT